MKKKNFQFFHISRLEYSLKSITRRKVISENPKRFKEKLIGIKPQTQIHLLIASHIRIKTLCKYQYMENYDSYLIDC